MKRFTPGTLATAVALALFLAPVLASSTAAQELESGTWTGTLEPPEGGEMAVSFEVTGGAEPSITMAGQGQFLVLENIELTDDALHFTFDMGTFIVCELLVSDEGGFAGECVGDDGESGFITMVPPQT